MTDEMMNLRTKAKLRSSRARPLYPHAGRGVKVALISGRFENQSYVAHWPALPHRSFGRQFDPLPRVFPPEAESFDSIINEL